MMAAIGEGLSIVRHANSGKTNRAADAFARSLDLDDFAWRVSNSGEGRWTVLAALEEGVPAPVITASLYERFQSRQLGEFTDEVLSAIRSEFGRHAEKKQ